MQIKKKKKTCCDVAAIMIIILLTFNTCVPGYQRLKQQHIQGKRRGRGVIVIYVEEGLIWILRFLHYDVDFGSSSQRF